MATSPWWVTILPTELVHLRRRLVSELFPEYGNTLGSEVEDVIQHAFVALFRRVESVSAANDGLYRYLKTVASNAAVDRIRTGVRHKQHLPAVNIGRKCSDSPAAGPDAEPGGNAEESERIQKVFCALGEFDRLVIWRHVVEGRSIRAISRDLDVNWHNVARTIERTLRRVRREVGEDGA